MVLSVCGYRSVCKQTFYWNSLVNRLLAIIGFLIVQVVLGLDGLRDNSDAIAGTYVVPMASNQHFGNLHHHNKPSSQFTYLAYPTPIRSVLPDNTLYESIQQKRQTQSKYNRILLDATTNRLTIKNKSFVNYDNSTLVSGNLHHNRHPLTVASPTLQLNHSNGRPSRSIDYDYNRNYFEQLNAHNHKPINVDDPMVAQESESRMFRENDAVTATTAKVAAASEPESMYQGRSNHNVMYYSPYSHGKGTPVTTSPMKAAESQQSPYVYIYPNTTPNYLMPLASSVDKQSIHHPATTNSSVSDSSHTGANQKPNSAWSIPYSEGNKVIGHKSYNPHERSDYAYSYSSELNKKLLDKYYNQDLSSMTSLLNKHPPPGTEHMANNHNQKSTESVDATNEDDNDDDNNEDEDAAIEDSSDKEHDGIAYYSKHDATINANNNNYLDYAALKNTKFNEHLLSDIKGSPRNGETVYRVHTPAKMMRHYTGRSSMPIRYQAAHTHALPQMSHYAYSMPPSTIESEFHHHVGSEKSNSWLGSGLAAGILIGAIPFGIMMASMMPTLITGAMPIVNTAAVGRRRRRRSTDIKNHILDQTLDTLGVLIRKGFTEFINLNGQNRQANQANYMSKNNVVNEQPIYNLEEDPANDVLKMVTKYALAAVDEPKCIKEMLCSLVASGKNSKTTALQKALYILVKWVPKDIERSLGLNGLFGAVRKNACYATYKCPSNIIDAMRKRSRTSAATTLVNARKMT